MELFTIVRPEHLNHYGNLFGGQMLKWVDEYAYLAAIREFPGELLVTRAMDRVIFSRRVPNGSMLRFDVKRGTIGVSSVTYDVVVYARESGKVREYDAFETSITFVCVDAEHRKKSLPAPLDAADDTQAGSPA